MKFPTGLATSIALVAAVSASAAWASHGRGGAVVPSVDANGLLSFDLISYWDPTGVSEPFSVSFSVSGPGGSSSVTGPKTFSDFGDARREEHTYSGSTQLSQAGLYTISWSSCCMTGGIRNLPSSSSADFGTESTIYWDGNNATTPILFDLENIQQEVVRGDAYSDNLDAVGGPGMTLTYGNFTSVTDLANASQPPGYSVDATGQITMDAASTAGLLDNSSRPTGGADYLFTGEIAATGGGRTQGTIEYFWLFDAVDNNGNQNRAPTVSDIIVNAVVGDTIMETVTATDPDGDTVTLTLDNFVGGGVTPADIIFDPVTGKLTWDSTGFAPGTYIATIKGSDGSLTDIGSVRINLTRGGGVPAVPLPASALLLLAGVGGLGLMRRKASKKS